MAQINSLYNKIEYWDERFKNEEEYEWLVNYNELKEKLQQILDKKNKNYKKDKYLIIGCGNSNLGRDMINDGFENIVNIDYSEVVINKMKKKDQNQVFLQMDIRKMKFEDEKFDIILDKATIDALQVENKDPWNVDEKTIANLDKCFKECLRVLKQDGLMIMISFDQPHFRTKLLINQNYHWTVDVLTINKGIGYFIYVCTKIDSLSFSTYYSLIQTKKQQELLEKQNYAKNINKNLYDQNIESELEGLFRDTDYKKCNYSYKDYQIDYYALQTGSTDYDLTGQIAWQGAFMLCNFMIEKQGKDFYEGKRVLELGSGPGVSGLCANKLKASLTVLSDYQQVVLDMIQETVQNIYHQEHHKLGFVQLDWTKVQDQQYFDSLIVQTQLNSPTFFFKNLSFDVVIASDVVYWPQSIIPLINVLNILFKNNHNLVFYMAYTERNTSTHQLLLTTLTKNKFSFSQIALDVSQQFSNSFIYQITK